MAEIICLNVFIYTLKGFISHCEKCEPRLPALIIIHLNLPGTELVSMSAPSSVLWKARRFRASLSTCGACIIRVIQMYPQSTGRGSVTAMLWWWGSERGCDCSLVWQLIYCITFNNVEALFAVETPALFLHWGSSEGNKCKKLTGTLIIGKKRMSVVEFWDNNESAFINVSCVFFV